MFENFYFGKNVVTKYIDFMIDEDKPLEEQVLYLKEDMIQIGYDNGLTLDVGWYPELDINGVFILYVIRGRDWEHPRVKKKCKDLKSLCESINHCVKYICDSAQS